MDTKIYVYFYLHANYADEEFKATQQSQMYHSTHNIDFDDENPQLINNRVNRSSKFISNRSNILFRIYFSTLQKDILVLSSAGDRILSWDAKFFKFAATQLCFS